MGTFTNKFAHLIPSLSYAEKHVLYYIDKHLDIAKTQSLTEMAKSINVSTTTIVRMCHKLGLDGFSELKFHLRKLEENKIPINQNVVSIYEQNVRHSFLNIDLENITHICSLMLNTNRVIIVAVGLSKMIGEYFSKLLLQINKPTLYVYESHIIDLLFNMVTKTDLVIFISSSGETKTILNIAEKFKYHNYKTVGITNEIDCTLAKLTTYILSTNVQRSRFAGYDLTPRSTLMMLVDMLFELFLIEFVEKNSLK